MIIVLKVILSLFIIMDFFVAKNLFNDYTETTKTEEYKEITLWDKLRLKFIFWFSISALVALSVFLAYFVIIPLEIVW